MLNRLNLDMMRDYPSFMQSWKKSSSRTKRVAVLLFDEFSNHCLANLIEPLRAANVLSGRRLYDWQHLSPDGRAVVSSSGLEIRPEAPLEFAQGDMLAVIPSYGFRRFARDDTARALRAAANRFRILMGLDTGSWLLARAGLLDGRRATIHFDELAGFAESFPQVDVEVERFVIDGNRITGSGAMATFDLMLHLIAEDAGTALRQDVAALFMSDETRRAPRMQDRLVARAVQRMRERLEDPLPIAALSRELGVSQKTLDARMKATMGATPQQVYRRERLLLARRLVRETALSVAEVGLRCGYQNPAALTRAFREEFGTTPRAIRAG